MITQPYLIACDRLVDAWLEASKILIQDGDRFNLTIHIRHPASVDEHALRRYCPTNVEHQLRKSVFDVANTIFPKRSRFHNGPVAEFFDHYLRVYRRGQAGYRSSWGCYFLRLIAFGPSEENQLGKIIHALNTWDSNSRAAFVVHLSSASLDNPRHMGAPCWQYGQFIRNEDSTLSLVAVYRSHDYFTKALGNFIGLSRMLQFVCDHSKMTPGTLTCLSTYATVQGKAGKLRRLIESAK
jgi:hypothetical protein